MKESIDAAIDYGLEGIQLTNKHNGGAVIDEVVDRIVGSRGG